VFIALSLILSSLIMMDLLGFFLFGVLCTSWFEFLFPPQTGEVFWHYLFKYVSYSFLLSSDTLTCILSQMVSFCLLLLFHFVLQMRSFLMTCPDCSSSLISVRYFKNIFSLLNSQFVFALSSQLQWASLCLLFWISC
jgi:hypothetical protein